MKFNKTFAEGIALLILALFGLFGAIVLGAVLHEYSHVDDFSGIAENEKICGLVLPNKINGLFSQEIGYYSFSIEDNNKNADKIKNIDKYTELKAYSISAVILLIFIGCFEIVFRSFRELYKNQSYL